MVKQPSSIFNDVIGPVMRGPSSSHVAAAARMGKLMRQMVSGSLKKVVVDFDPQGSLATTYHGHGSDIGLVGGLLGFAPKDPRLVTSLQEAKQTGLDVSFNVVDYPAKHPNTYRMTATSDKNETINITAISTGGGMIEIQEIEGFRVSVAGDFHELFVFIDHVDGELFLEYEMKIKDILGEIDYCDCLEKEKEKLINIKYASKISEEKIKQIKEMGNVKNIIELEPVLPIMSRKNCQVPFSNAKDMIKVAEKENLKLWELATLYESKRGNISKEEVFEKMKSIVSLMQTSIESGLEGTEYEDRILGKQAWMIEKSQKEGKLIPGTVLNTVIGCITSMMEVKSSMGVFVAAPTAGSAGGLPGTIIGTAKEMGLSIDEATKAMLAAGIIGVFISEHATFAAEVGGCQVECGAGSGMAAGGLVQLLGGSAIQGVNASSVALQNIMGMVCDPVADRVEVPCLGKNVMAGANAIACANMILAGFDHVIPLDETIDAMYKVGKMLPSELRCTGNGGLSITPTALKIYKDIN